MFTVAPSIAGKTWRKLERLLTDECTRKVLSPNMMDHDSYNKSWILPMSGNADGYMLSQLGQWEKEKKPMISPLGASDKKVTQE